MKIQLPEDIIYEEILPRVPAKSLLQFKCVSKHWCSLISSNLHFNKTHLHFWRSKPPGVITQLHGGHYIFHDKETGERFELKLSKLFKDNNSFLPFTSCYGLLLVQSLDFSNSLSLPKFYVCNPITRQSTKLPQSPYWLNPCEIGYVSMTNKFKVFSWSARKGCAIFTLGDVGKDESSWRMVPLPSGVGEMYSRAVSAYGALYWVAVISTEDFNTLVTSYGHCSSSTSCILCMDINKEEIKQIGMPEEDYNKPPVLVGMDNDGLYAVFDSEENLEKMVMWELDDWKNHTWRKVGKGCVSVYDSVREIVGKDRLKLQGGILPLRDGKKDYTYCIDHVNTLVSWDGKEFDMNGRKWYLTKVFGFILCALLYLFFSSFVLNVQSSGFIVSLRLY